VDVARRVYRRQSAKINDQRLEVIVRRTLWKFRVKTAGGAEFLVGESVDRPRFEAINRAIIRMVRKKLDSPKFKK
jgi:DNA-directed RNA polymerase subunit beta'